MFMPLILLSESQGFLTSGGLIVPRNGFKIFLMSRAILLVALPMLEIMGRGGMSGL